MNIKKLVAVSLFLVGLVNFLPVMGVVGVPALENMYGIALPSAEVALLMQHRALLFGIIGGMMMVASFQEHLKAIAFLSGGISMAGFMILYMVAGINQPKLDKIFMVDAFALLLLLFVGGCYLYQRRREGGADTRAPTD